jgi:hypothetical protein
MTYCLASLNQVTQHWDDGAATARVSKRLTYETADCLAILKGPRPFDSSARSSLRRLLLRALPLESVSADDVSRAENLFTG